MDPDLVYVVGGKGDDEGLVIMVVPFTEELVMSPGQAFRLGRKLIRQALAEKVGVAW
ncbi:hypothetical protein SEA_PUPPER_36 [Gordonia phage Pupper]|uniref:Uncharacterized protein n=1 Tax=Gordonia phage Pupper TaxID=2571249 RepID=A0A4Y6EIH6_9CAUD|nr:hypothetical protein KHQ83_gp036 [Gordonia phage Pupper]QDF18523.1 hypothetical protein SEA_PUPPER_36 [Gordonia phage Pupper]QDF18756.1 hypothetical protein SEA_SCENTAE_36 [Gordonia phage SCentae]